MLKIILNKTKRNFLRKSSLHFQKSAQTLSDTKIERSLPYFLELKSISLDTYMLFSPDKFVEDYIDYLNLHYKEAEEDFICITFERFYIVSLLLFPKLAKKTLLTLKARLANLIKEDREMFLTIALKIAQEEYENLEFKIEKVH
jgi:hypothetical protein